MDSGILGRDSRLLALRDVTWVARLLGVSKSWVYQAVAAGRIPCVRIGSAVRFNPNVIKEAVKEGMREVLQEFKNTLGTMSARRATDDFWPVRKAAKVAGVSPWMVREWIKGGQLPSFGKGRLLRVRRSHFEAFIATLARTQPGRIDTEQLAREIAADRKPKR